MQRQFDIQDVFATYVLSLASLREINCECIVAVQEPIAIGCDATEVERTYRGWLHKFSLKV